MKKARYTLLKNKMRGIKTGKLMTRSKVILLCVFCLSIYLLMQHQSRDHSGDFRFFRDNMKYLDSLNVTECKLPEYNLYDPEISKYINKPPTDILCGYEQPYLTFLEWDGYLHLNETEVKQNEFEGKSKN